MLNWKPVFVCKNYENAESINTGVDLKNLQAGNVPVKFYNVATITIRTLCFNTFPGSKMEKGTAVSFKLKGNSNLPIKDI